MGNTNNEEFELRKNGAKVFCAAPRMKRLPTDLVCFLRSVKRQITPHLFPNEIS